MHLIQRFFGFLLAKPLMPGEQQDVRNRLDPALARVFFAQRPEDQRHAFEVQQRVGGSKAMAEAALLHDAGKTESNLGAVSRSFATLANGFGLPTSGSWSSYLAHGQLGAEILAELHAGEIAIAFARFHPGPPPPGIDPNQWRLLEEADNR
jgi:hypothetical protein